MWVKIIYAFWPNKHSIYQEYMPFSMLVQKKGEYSLADQLKEYFSEKRISFIDVREALLKNKSENQLYYKFDTHWNQWGSYIGYKSFFEQTFQQLNITPYPIDSFIIKKSIIKKGDLTNFLAVDSIKGFEDSYIIFSFISSPMYEYLPIDGFPSNTIITRNNHSNNKNKVLIFRDSFTTALEQFISLHFFEVYYIWSQFDTSYVNKINPDIIISCPVERNLLNL